MPLAMSLLRASKGDVMGDLPWEGDPDQTFRNLPKHTVKDVVQLVKLLLKLKEIADRLPGWLGARVISRADAILEELPLPKP